MEKADFGLLRPGQNFCPQLSTTVLGINQTFRTDERTCKKEISFFFTIESTKPDEAYFIFKPLL